MNIYLVWVKGQKLTTATEIKAGLKINALIRFAGARDLKTIQCDAKLLMRNVSKGYKSI